MGKSFFITGTGTDIGKTIATGFLYFALNKLGIKTTVFKPFQTGLIEQTQIYPDLGWYESVLGLKNTGCFVFEPETSPHLAIKIQQSEVNIETALQRKEELEQTNDLVLIEGAGGLAVPLIEKQDSFYMTKDFIQAANIPAVLVSLSGLGSIHNVLTTNLYAKTYGIPVHSLIFNKFDEESIIHRDNFETIQKMIDLPAFTIPEMKNVKQDLEDYVDICMASELFRNKMKGVFCNVSIH